jgi:hypothetical protein
VNWIRTLPHGRRLLLLPFLLLAAAGVAWGQETEREHFQIKFGASYDQGDFGSTEASKVFFTPITFRYLGERFDFSVTPSFALVESAGGLRLIEGVATPTGETGAFRDTASGAGDTVVRARFFLLQSATSGISPFVRVKIPTARDDLELGTGRADYGFGVEIDRQVGSVLLFGDAGYTLIGKPTGLDLRNRVSASFGAGHRLSDSLVLSGLLDWRRSLIGGSDPTELVGVLTYGISPTVSVSPNVYTGLTDSSPDFGVGIEFSFRFGRW